MAIYDSSCCGAIHAKDLAVDEGVATSGATCGATILMVNVKDKAQLRLTIAAAVRLQHDLALVLGLLPSEGGDDE